MKSGNKPDAQRAGAVLPAPTGGPAGGSPARLHAESPEEVWEVQGASIPMKPDSPRCGLASVVFQMSPPPPPKGPPSLRKHKRNISDEQASQRRREGSHRARPALSMHHRTPNLSAALSLGTKPSCWWAAVRVRLGLSGLPAVLPSIQTKHTHPTLFNF